MFDVVVAQNSHHSRLYKDFLANSLQLTFRAAHCDQEKEKQAQKIKEKHMKHCGVSPDEFY